MLKRSKFEKTFRDVRHAKCQITWIRSKMAAHVAAKVKHMAAHAHTNLATATTITNNLQHDHHTCRHMAAWNGPSDMHLGRACASNDNNDEVARLEGTNVL